MTSPIPQDSFFSGVWSSAAHYLVPPCAAAVAIVPPFFDMIAKSAQQKGEPIPNISIRQRVRLGLAASPTIGGIVGGQMVLQNIVEKVIASDTSFSSSLGSSAVVGAVSAPALAIFNGQTMGLNVKEALQRFSGRQGLAITVRETAFVASLSITDPLTKVMREHFGEAKIVDLTTAFAAGATGSLIGHPADTALTRWQSGLPIDHPKQLMLGAVRKARGIGVFSVLYKMGRELLTP